jgi:carboxypeptidase D
MAVLEEQAKSCGYTDFYDTHINQFPPKGPFPPGPDYHVKGCDIYDNIYNAIYYVNPCFNIYHLTDFCPFLWDELGFPSLGTGPNNYFNRTGKRLSVFCMGNKVNNQLN